VGLFLLLSLLLAGCGRTTPSPTPRATPQSAASANSTTSPTTESPTTSAKPSDAGAYTFTPTPLPTKTATPLATVTPTPTDTPSPTATSTPTLTPTPAPAVLLTEANRLLRNGDYGAAVDAHQAFLDQHPDHAEAGEAAFGKGKALLLDGDPAAAILAFADATGKSAFVAAHPEIFYWLGRAYAANGDAQNAAAAFGTYAERQPGLAARAYQAAGDAYAATLDAPNAIASYQQALAAAPDTVSALRAREGIARMNLQAGDPDSAMAQYQAILEIARSPNYRAEMLYLLGQAQQVAGRTDAAYATFQRTIATAPENHYAYLALVELVNAGQPVDDLLRGRIDLAEGEYWPAISALHRYLDAAPEHDAEAHVLAARAYEGLGDYASAASEWQTIIDTHPGEDVEGEARLGLARSFWRRDDTANARQIYLQTVERNPDPETAATALWWASVLAERDDASLLESAEDYANLAESFPESEYAARAAFRAGLSYYRLNDYDAARIVWESLAEREEGLWSAGADYWLGKILLVENQPDAAVLHWRDVAERWGVGNYYGLRAAQAVAGQTGESLNPDPPSASDLATWLRTWTDREIPDDLTQPRPEFEQATALHKIGETTAARSIFETLRRRWWNNPVASLQLALYAQALGYYDTSIRAAARVQALSGQPLVDTPLALQKLIYPIHFPDLILPAAEKYDLDPAIFLGLVRQESLFGSAAISSAAARGLTQVIPSTGRSIAQQLDWPDYRDELLYRPYVSVEFGSFYLGQGIEGAQGNVPQALAGYNGGPGNAAYWRKLAGEDDDLFLELVSFAETQLYLRTIAVQANHYRRLYPELVSP